MCRNITILHGLEPGATEVEIRAAALQYVRKVSGIRTVTPKHREAFDLAVDRISSATGDLLAGLGPRRQPPTTVPPLRRPEVVARIAARGRRDDDM